MAEWRACGFVPWRRTRSRSRLTGPRRRANPGLADAGPFAFVDPEGFLIGELDGAPASIMAVVNYDASWRSRTTTASVFQTARMYSGAIRDVALERVFGVTTFELG